MKDLEDSIREAHSARAPGSLDRDIGRLIAAHERAAAADRPSVLPRTGAILLTLAAGFLLGRWHERRSAPAPAPVIIAMMLPPHAERMLDLTTTKEPSDPFLRPWDAVLPVPARSTR